MLRPVEDVRTLLSFIEVAHRWGVSPFTVRRQADAGEIQTIFIGSRRLVPIREVKRVEKQGLPRRTK